MGKKDKKKGGKKKKLLEEARERTAERLRKRLDIKKRVVEGWHHEHAAPLKQPEELAQLLEKLGILPTLLSSWHAGAIASKSKKLAAAARRISVTEVRVGQLPEELRRDLSATLFRYFDLNGDGEVDQEEVVLILSAVVVSDAREAARFSFLVHDTDHDERLDTEELRHMLRLKLVALKVIFELDCSDAGDEALGPVEEVQRCKERVQRLVFDSPQVLEAAIRSLLQHADVNRDGLVSLEEFEQWASDHAAIEALGAEVARNFQRNMEGYEYPSDKMKELAERSIGMLGGQLEI